MQKNPKYEFPTLVRAILAALREQGICDNFLRDSAHDFKIKYNLFKRGIWSRPFDHCSPSSKAWKGVEKVWLVPHELTQQNKDNRVTTFTALLERHEQRPFLHHLITGDEKWILFRNFKRKKVV
uniref:Transposase n=1 Tax=Ditylenchus dipsaci TaxID=166011 RepID=A0A915CNG8_9BILA